VDLDSFILSGTEVLLEGPNETVVIAGAGATGLAAAFAKRYSLPLFAEPSSDARYGEAVIKDYGALLATDAAKKIRQVVVFGKPTLNRSVIKLIQNPEVSVQVVISPSHGHFDIASNAKNQAVSYKFANPANPDWLTSWKDQDVKEDLADELTRQGIIEKLWEISTADDAILLGASAIARDADKYAPAIILNIFSNRGLSGIDGTISTALGIAQQTEGTTRALMGDLTFIHDLAALNKTGLPNLDVQIIVVNDHGGKIFQRLEIAKLAEPESFEKLFKTPQQVSIEQVALAFGWNYRKPKTLIDYQQALRTSGSWVIELELD
jgi:2-succinyl-5-enolpyruvyl-6-hydroxy-3-cyclohexene-1-carboxylate synthase